MITTTLTVNDRVHAVTAEATATVLDVLRDHFGLTGAKRGCNYGVCGTCSVLIDGKLARACLSLAANCAGRAVTTIEAIGQGGALDPLQRCLVETGAVQCGFCSPAMVLAIKALLATNPHPTAAEIGAAISGNICRCSGYGAIIEAVTRATEGAAP